MVDPGMALLVFGIVVAVLSVLFWPGRGLVAAIARVVRMTERVRIEDALKHLHNCEYAGVSCSVESLAGALQTSRAGAARLITRLQELGLAGSDGQGFPLTDQGRAYALRIIRTHRLLERYMADRTGVQPGDWHEEAEIREHRLSAAETEQLSARLGHPRFDPHGDPIPTAEGDIPPRSGVPLTALTPGEKGSIVHLEDEPREVYDALIRRGLSPLMKVQVLEPEGNEVRFRAGGRVHGLEPVAAGSVTVVPAPDASVAERAVETLADLDAGETARVVQIARACQGLQRRRLLDLGLVPGTDIRAELVSMGGDPAAYRIRGALIALRKEQASWVQVERRPAEVAAARATGGA